MLPALNISALVSLHVRACIIDFLLQLQSISTRNSIPPWGSFNNTFPCTVSLPLSLPFLCCFPLILPFPLPFPVAILCSLCFSSAFVTTLRAILSLAVIIDSAIGRMLPSTALGSGISPVFIIIILIDYLIPIQPSNSQDIACLELPAAWWLNLYPRIIATVTK